MLLFHSGAWRFENLWPPSKNPNSNLKTVVVKYNPSKLIIYEKYDLKIIMIPKYIWCLRINFRGSKTKIFMWPHAPTPPWAIIYIMHNIWSIIIITQHKRLLLHQHYTNVWMNKAFDSSNIFLFGNGQWLTVIDLCYYMICSFMFLG